MIITTTATIEGKNIIQYSGIVTAQVFMGVNIFRDIFSGVRDIVGGRSKSMENELNRAKDLLIKEIKEEAIMLNANAIVGLKIDFEDVGKTSGNAFMLFGTGTAVVL
ncbi:MAG: heavy metal-binding domain-containing protein [Thermodesulfobacteriota bacterium]